MIDTPELTPIEQLDAAVHRWAMHMAQQPGVTTAWVVGWQFAAIDDAGDTSYAAEYAIGPSTTIAEGVGIARIASLKMERDIVSVKVLHEDTGDDE